ncbi:hypothetical protein OG389_23385 [Streptomyces sp. NBC_00435]|uniref:hypothetical protein n=1 Tax=Streptomyces sp. NBC_00435 TaxID=2903649 RepID=UPI002E1C35ED
MSFGDPNNPYGQQPQGGQPGYGYPQQAPQGIPPQGYGYPQQPQGYPGVGGYPGANVPMPGGVSGARVILFILGGLQALFGVLLGVGGAVFAAALSDSSSSSASSAGTAAGGVFIIFGVLVVGMALWPILTAAKLSKGRGGVRVSGIIFGSLMSLFAGLGLIFNIATLSSMHSSGAGTFMISLIFTGIELALGLWILIGLANSAASVYFKRPQY